MNPSISSTARTTRSLRVGSLGNSIAAMYGYDSLGAEFVRVLRLIAGNVTLANGVDVVAYALGGTYGSQANRTADYNWQLVNDPSSAAATLAASVECDDTGGSPADGSLVALSVTRMAARGASDKIDCLIMNHGHADAGTAQGSKGSLPTTAASRWYSAWVYSIPRYRLNCTAGNTASTKIGVEIIGRYSAQGSRGTMGVERIRQKQLALIAATTGLFKSAETYDLELNDSVHPSMAGQKEQARRTAEMVARNVLGKTVYASDGTTIYAGPSITGVTKLTHTTVQVTISGNGESVSYPDDLPCCFRFGDAAANYDAVFATASAVPVQAPVSFTRDGNVLTFTLSAPITGSIALFFPFDDLPGFDIDRVIYGASSRKPLQSWARS